MWGVRDTQTIEKYGDAIIELVALEQILSSFEKHCIKATLPPLVFYFIKTKKDLLENVPIMKPSYTIEKLSPYLNIENYLGENEAEDPYYFLAMLHQK
jgi:hypothetical protein